MNLPFRQENIGDIVRLVLDIEDDDELDSFALNMMRHNDIEHIIAVQKTQFNSESYLQFNITGMRTLQERLQQIMNKKESISIFEGIIRAYEEADAYMLLENNFFLDTRYVFIDKNDSCNLLYLPFKQDIGNDRIEFLKNLARMVKPDYSEKDTYIFDIVNAFSRGAISKVADFKELLRKSNKLNAENNVWTVPKPKSEPIETNVEKAALQEEERETKKLVKNANESSASGAAVLNIPGKDGVSVNIPGKNGVSVNIPGKNGMAVNIPQKKTTDSKKKTDKRNDEKVKEDKKSRQIKWFGKKNNDKKEMKTESDIQNENNNERAHAYESTGYAAYEAGRQNEGDRIVYQSYEPTVFMDAPQQEAGGETYLLNGDIPKNEDRGATVLLDEEKKTAELIRKNSGEHIPVSKIENVYGSGDGADYVIRNNMAISRKHATIAIRGGSFFIMDNQSKNGTFVNGVRIVPGQIIEISNGSMIRLADEDFEFRVP